ncbi:MAG: hypothetical protein LW884_01150 [Bacteroidetes bacterium]|nr:hypothetical protein [Bacteroidota bacterium]
MLLLPLLLLPPYRLQAQFNTRPRLQLGGSLGLGGTYMYGKASADLGFRGTSLHLAPGLGYLSVGLSQKLFYLKRLDPGNRYIAAMLEASWHDDWGLTAANRAGNSRVRDLDLYQLLVGLRIDLRPQGLMYLDVNLGVLYAMEKYKAASAAEADPASGQFWLPMAQIRLGFWIRRNPGTELYSKPVKWYYHRKGDGKHREESPPATE